MSLCNNDNTHKSYFVKESGYQQFLGGWEDTQWSLKDLEQAALPWHASREQCTGSICPRGTPVYRCEGRVSCLLRLHTPLVVVWPWVMLSSPDLCTEASHKEERDQTRAAYRLIKQVGSSHLLGRPAIKSLPYGWNTQYLNSHIPFPLLTISLFTTCSTRDQSIHSRIQKHESLGNTLPSSLQLFYKLRWQVSLWISSPSTFYCHSTSCKRLELYPLNCYFVNTSYLCRFF